VRKLLTIVWRRTFEPVHRRLFRRYFQAIINRQNMTLGQLGELQAHVQDLRRAVDAEAARAEALRLQVRDLDVQVRNALAARWEDAALSRRMAALEDRLRAAAAGGARADGLDTPSGGPDAGNGTESHHPGSNLPAP
jgi:BMFP domain-containing protein YqiC